MSHSSFIATAAAYTLARETEPHLTDDQIRAHADDGGLLIVHGCKLTRRQRGAVRWFVVSGYAMDGSDTRAALEHLTDKCSRCCGPEDNSMTGVCLRCGTKHPTKAHAKTNGRDYFCTWCGDLAPTLHF